MRRVWDGMACTWLGKAAVWVRGSAGVHVMGEGGSRVTLGDMWKGGQLAGAGGSRAGSADGCGRPWERC